MLLNLINLIKNFLNKNDFQHKKIWITKKLLIKNKREKGLENNQKNYNNME